MIRRLCITIVLCLSTHCAAQGLRIVTTDHYIIHTDLDPVLTDDLAMRMDAMWQEYAHRLCDFSPPQNAPKLQAYLLAGRGEYMHLTGNRFPNTGGIFIPSKNLLASFLETQGRDGIRRALQHEAFHQFAHLAISPKLPIWLNEGIAQIFEEGIWTGNSFLIGQVPPKRVYQLQQDIRESRLTDFTAFMNQTNEQWASNMRYMPIAITQYNQAWAMTQFLIFATDDHGQPKYRDRLLAMLRSVHAGEDGQAAFTDCFSGNIAGFRHLFDQWAQTLTPTAEATYNEHQAVLADMLISLGMQGQQFADIASFRRCLDDGTYRLQSRGANAASPSEFFCDLTGRPLGPGQLYFAFAPGAAAPDIVCRPAADLELRTHFLRGSGGAIDYETSVETE
jgi:hypothetical protein